MTGSPARARSLVAAVSAARRGDLILVPTESVYALATDPFNRRGMDALRLAKRSPGNVPTPVMVPDLATVAGLSGRISHETDALMTAFWPGLLTLLVTPQPTLSWEFPAGAPLALRMPLHPVLLDLLRAAGPLAVTGANLAGMSPPETVDEAYEHIGDAIIVALDVGARPGSDDALPSSVVDVRGATPILVRDGAISLEDLRTICPDIEQNQR